VPLDRLNPLDKVKSGKVLPGARATLTSGSATRRLHFRIKRAAAEAFGPRPGATRLPARSL